MNRIAVLADIHGNLTALEAVLADMERQGVEQCVCLGDVAATGPQPREVTERLRALGCPVVLGNADDWMVDPVPTPDADERTRQFEEMDLWCAEQLGQDLLAWMGAFQPTVDVALGEGAMLHCFHGSPRSFHDIIRATTPDEELERLLAGIDATVLAGGHTHERLLRWHAGRTLINPGSVGMAVGGPWAEYAIVEVVDDVERATFQRVPLDVTTMCAVARASGMPHVEWWIGLWG